MWWMCYSEKLNIVFFIEGHIDPLETIHIPLEDGVVVIESNTWFPLHSDAGTSPEEATAIVNSLIQGPIH